MTTDQFIVLTILVVALLVFASDRLRVDVVALSVLVALVLTGVLETEEALSGLSNPAVVTVFAVFILSGALVTTGVADQLAEWMLHVAGTQQWRVVTVLMLTCGLMSAFMNNIGATAILLPATLVMSERTKIPASKLLMPLAFSSLLGGNITAIGTPPNILANGIMADHPDLEPFGFFDFAPTGIPILLVGVAYMAIAGQWLLPSRSRSGRLIDHYRVDDYLSTITIGPNSSLVGLTVDEAELGFHHHVRLLAIRPQDVAAETLTPRESTRLATGDRLIVQATLAALAEFRNQYGSDTKIDDGTVSWTDPVRGASVNKINVVEVMIAPDSKLIGHSVADLDLRARLGVIPLALRRPHGNVRTAPGRIKLQAGDSLVVTGVDHRLAELYDSDDFIPLHRPNLVLRRRSKAPIAVAAMLAVLVASVLGIVSIAIAMLTGAIALVVSRTISMDEAYASVDWKAVFLIAGMLPLGTAMEKTGTALLLAEKLTDVTGGAGPLWVMLGVYALTVAITSVVSNAAATALIVPIAIDAALAIDADPRTFVMATVIAASTAFMLPIGHQVNVLIYTPGNYRFSDFARAGTGLTIVIMGLVALLVPVVWPF